MHCNDHDIIALGSMHNPQNADPIFRDSLERNNAVGDGATTLNASPAKAGVHLSAAGAADRWVPAFPTDQVPPDQVRGQARAAPGLKAHGKAIWAWFHPLRGTRKKQGDWRRRDN